MSTNHDAIDIASVTTCSSEELDRVDGGFLPLLFIAGVIMLGIASGCDSAASSNQPPP